MQLALLPARRHAKPRLSRTARTAQHPYLQAKESKSCRPAQHEVLAVALALPLLAQCVASPATEPASALPGPSPSLPHRRRAGDGLLLPQCFARGCRLRFRTGNYRIGALPLLLPRPLPNPTPLKTPLARRRSSRSQMGLRGCRTLETVNFGPLLERIGKDALRGSSLTGHLDLSRSLELNFIGESAFENVNISSGAKQHATLPQPVGPSHGGPILGDAI